MAEEEQKNTPQHLYHYYKIDEKHPEYTEAIFTKNEIYFDSPLNYNDPFDTKIHFKVSGTPQQEIAFLINEWDVSPDLVSDIVGVSSLEEKWEPRLNQLFDKHVREKTGIYCLSKKKDNILIWSHYADCHQGFCLKFSTNNMFFNSAFKIIYNTSLPVVDCIKEEFCGIIKAIRCLSSKAKGWKYEEEWRLFNTLKGPGVYTFPPEALTGVIFGCRITSENKTKIINWCRQRNPRPQLYNAVPKETEYGLDIVPFDYPAYA